MKKKDRNKTIAVTQNKKPWFLAYSSAFITALTIFTFGVTLKNGYSLDDNISIYENNFVSKGIRGIPDILVNPYMVVDNYKIDYRPVSQITFAIEQELIGFNPMVSHGVNLIIYIFIGLLLFHLLTKIFFAEAANGQTLSLFTTLIFLLHPSHNEVVNSLKNREELLSFLMILLWLYSTNRITTKFSCRWAALGIVFLLFSLLSKLVSLQFVYILIFWFWIKREELFNRQQKLFFLLSALISTAIVFIIYWNSNRPVSYFENPLGMHADISQRLAMSCNTLWFYVCFMVFPYPERFYYGYNMIPIDNSSKLQPFILAMLFITVALLLIKYYKQYPTPIFLLGAFVASLTLYLNFIYPYTGIVAERPLFQGSLFFISGVVFFSFQNYKPWYIYPLLILLGGYCFLDIKRAKDWQSEISLMDADLPKLQNSALGNFIAGSVYFKKCDTSTDYIEKKEYSIKAISALNQSLKIAPNNVRAYYFLGSAYQFGENELDSALLYYKTGSNIDSLNPEINIAMGRVHCIKGDFLKASSIFARLYKYVPTDSNVLYLHSRCQFNIGNKESGISLNQKLIKNYPNFSNGYLNQGWFFEQLGYNDSAKCYYQKALDLGNSDTYLLNFVKQH